MLLGKRYVIFNYSYTMSLLLKSGKEFVRASVG